jgi:DNA-binding NarL/FixJ family response regulator
MTRLRLLVVDDHPLLRAGLRALVAAQPDFELAGEAGDATAALALARAADPDLVLLDLGLPDRSGIALLRELGALPRPPRIVVLTLHDEPALVRAALAAGAAGYVVKSAGEAEIVAALRAVAHGRLFVDAPAGAAPPDAALVPLPLSARERQVLSGLARGETSREIAARLGIGLKSVETYRARLREQLGLAGRGALARFARESGGR